MTTFQCSLITMLLLLISISHPSYQHQQPPPKLSAVDLAALISIKNSLTDLPGSSFFSTWDFTAPDPCSSFAGVTCSDVSGVPRVTTLSLGTGLSGSLGLAGSLPNALSQLTELTQLILNPGLVTGPIPPQLGRLANLQVLSLPHNRLTGRIPATLASLTGLHTLDLGFNHLTGPIPPTLLTELTRLKVLILAGNQLNGELPSHISESTQLLHLDLKSNLLVGPIPTPLPLSLRYVSLSENHMWGPINGLESLSELVYLDLSVNQLSGPLPTSLLRPSLSSLFLQRNNLSGHVICNDVIPYPEGSIIDVSHNAISGALPDALAGAESVFLNNNRFTGPVPENYVSGLVNGRTKTLYLQHNFLDSFPKNFYVGLLPDEVEVCLAYNCMVPPVGLGTCPASAGDQLSRPSGQCSVFHNN